MGEVKTIFLPKNQVAVVDDCDYDRIIFKPWTVFKSASGNFYAKRHVYGDLRHELVSMESEVLGVSSDTLIDHADRNPLNNTRKNLRPCTVSQNNANKRGWAKSGFKGVRRNISGRWEARIGINGKVISIGYTKSATDAAKLYNSFACLLFGEFAKLNLV